MKNTQKAREQRIRETYHCSLISGDEFYVVEVESCLVSGSYITRKWRFSTEQDAIEYCKNETGEDNARVVKFTFVPGDDVVMSKKVFEKI